MKKCLCGKGYLRPGKIDEEMLGIPLGRFPAEICDTCEESFVDQETMEEIENKARKLGIWGLAKKMKVAKSGNSLVVRIPAEIARFLNIEVGKEILLYPEGKKKLVFEVA